MALSYPRLATLIALLAFLLYQLHLRIGDSHSSRKTSTCGLNECQQRIAIVGAGASGLFLQHHLTQLGYKHITVYEKEPRAVPICDTVMVDGLPIDTSIVYVVLVARVNQLWNVLDLAPWPVGSIVSLLLGMLYKTPFLKHLSLGSHVAGAIDYDNFLRSLRSPIFDVTQAQSVSIDPYVEFPMRTAADADPYATVKQIVTFYKLSRNWGQAPHLGVQGCLDTGLAFANETFSQWSERHSVGILGKQIAFMLDFYGNPKSASAPACQVLSGAFLKYKGALAYYLLMATQKSPLTAALIPPSFMASLGVSLQQGNRILRRFQGGYCSVFEKTVQISNANFLFNEEVLSLSHDSATSSVNIKSTSGSKNFDKVILALRPHELMKLTDGISQFKFSRSTYHVQVVRSNYSISLITKSNLNYSNALELLAPTESSLGTPDTDMTGKLLGFVAPFFPKRPDLLVLLSNGEFPVSGSNSIIMPSGTEQTFSSKDLQDVLYDRVFDDGPNYVSMENMESTAAGPSFYKTVADMQGKRGVYYTGEYLAGHGIPENFMFAKLFADQHFGHPRE